MSWPPSTVTIRDCTQWQGALYARSSANVWRLDAPAKSLWASVGGVTFDLLTDATAVDVTPAGCAEVYSIHAGSACLWIVGASGTSRTLTVWRHTTGTTVLQARGAANAVPANMIPTDSCVEVAGELWVALTTPAGTMDWVVRGSQVSQDTDALRAIEFTELRGQIRRLDNAVGASGSMAAYLGDLYSIHQPGTSDADQTTFKWLLRDGAKAVLFSDTLAALTSSQIAVCGPYMVAYCAGEDKYNATIGVPNLSYWIGVHKEVPSAPAGRAIHSMPRQALRQAPMYPASHHRPAIAKTLRVVVLQ